MHVGVLVHALAQCGEDPVLVHLGFQVPGAGRPPAVRGLRQRAQDHPLLDLQVEEVLVEVAVWVDQADSVHLLRWHRSRQQSGQVSLQQSAELAEGHGCCRAPGRLDASVGVQQRAQPSLGRLFGVGERLGGHRGRRHHHVTHGRIGKSGLRRRVR